MNERITLVPIGPVPSGLLDWLEHRLPDSIEQEVTIGEEISRPENAYVPGRRQYKGEALLADLQHHAYPGASQVVGLIDADCYAPGLNFIFGQASIDRRDAIVALPRLRESFYGHPDDLSLFRERVSKEIVHELGHTWGLSHCPDPQCVMHFSNSLRETDRKEIHFCPQCQAQIQNADTGVSQPGISA